MIIIILIIILGFVAVSADIILIYTLFRFKRLRNPFNIFLANWAITDIFAIILAPITYLTAFMGRSISKELICSLAQAAVILHVTKILFGIVLCIDWCLAAYFRRLSEKFRKYYRYVIASIWVLTLLFYSIITGLCISDYEMVYLNMILFGIFYSISIIFVISLQCSRIVQKCRTFPVNYRKPLTLRLTLITVIIFSYLFGVIDRILSFLESYRHMNEFFVIAEIVSACAVLSSSVLILILLCFLNYNFRQCLFRLKRKVQHSQLDTDISEDEEAIRSIPEVTYRSSTQDIATNGYAELYS